MTGGGRFSRLEGSARTLVFVKLGNVALVLLWGFAVTYVFVRVLPLDTFQAFLLLIAFSNFTISAEFGLTSILYNRVRRHWLARGSSGASSSDEKGKPGSAFRVEELGALFALFMAVICVAALIVGICIAVSVIPTSMPGLFLLFFLTACLNMLLLLAKRALAALDRNLLWEAVDFVRRLLSLGLLLLALAGLDIMLSVALQMALSIGCIVIGLMLAGQRLGAAPRQWMDVRAGMAHVLAGYKRLAGASVALTLSEITAYNAPYFTIAAATQDPRPLLLFDFIFKLSRALSTAIRAVTEAVLPRITAAFYGDRQARFGQLIGRLTLFALAGATLACIALALLGQWLFAHLFDGHGAVDRLQLLLMMLLLLALSVICVSVYVQGALGRFAHLLRQSMPFLIGSLLSVPLALMTGSGDFATAFLAFYTLTFLVTAALHAASLARLAGRGQG